MKRSFLALVVTLLFCGPGFAQSAASDGWIPLFNGKDLSGLYTFRPADGKPVFTCSPRTSILTIR